MRNRKRPPAHPGRILKVHYIEPLNLTVSDLARNLKISRKTLSKIINEHGSITSEMALRFSKAFNTTPELWLNLQNNYDLWHVSHETIEWLNVQSVVPC
jgi:antitoxin HigA-1